MNIEISEINYSESAEAVEKFAHALDAAMQGKGKTNWAVLSSYGFVRASGQLLARACSETLDQLCSVLLSLILAGLLNLRRVGLEIIRLSFARAFAASGSAC